MWPLPAGLARGRCAARGQAVGHQSTGPNHRRSAHLAIATTGGLARRICSSALPTCACALRLALRAAPSCLWRPWSIHGPAQCRRRLPRPQTAAVGRRASSTTLARTKASSRARGRKGSGALGTSTAESPEMRAHDLLLAPRYQDHTCARVRRRLPPQMPETPPSSWDWWRRLNAPCRFRW